MPGSISTYKENAAANELAEVYKSTGETAIFPERNAPYKIEVSSGDDEKIKLTLDALTVSPESSQLYFVGRHLPEWRPLLFSHIVIVYVNT